MGITEHIEGDECKFSVWTGRAPAIENKAIMKANSIDAKHLWVKKLRELIKETYSNTATLPNIKQKSSTRLSREFDHNTSPDGSLENILQFEAKYNTDFYIFDKFPLAV